MTNSANKQLDINLDMMKMSLAKMMDNDMIFRENLEYINSFIPNYYDKLKPVDKYIFYKRIIKYNNITINNYLIGVFEKILLLIRKCIFILENNYDYPFITGDRKEYINSIISPHKYDNNFVKLLKNIRWQNPRRTPQEIIEKLNLFNKLLEHLPTKFNPVVYYSNNHNLTYNFICQFKEAERFYEHLLGIVSSLCTKPNI